MYKRKSKNETEEEREKVSNRWKYSGIKNRKSIEINKLNLHIWLREIKTEREKDMTSENETERQKDVTGEAVGKKALDRQRKRERRKEKERK